MSYANFCGPAAVASVLVARPGGQVTKRKPVQHPHDPALEALIDRAQEQANAHRHPVTLRDERGVAVTAYPTPNWKRDQQ